MSAAFAVVGSVALAVPTLVHRWAQRAKTIRHVGESGGPSRASLTAQRYHTCAACFGGRISPRGTPPSVDVAGRAFVKLIGVVVLDARQRLASRDVDRGADPVLHRGEGCLLKLPVFRTIRIRKPSAGPEPPDLLISCSGFAVVEKRTFKIRAGSAECLGGHMAIVIEYELAPVRHERGGRLAEASEMDLRYDFFLGDLVFRIDSLDLTTRWGWVPLVDAAMCLE